jgi:hypothetical protein
MHLNQSPSTSRSMFQMMLYALFQKTGAPIWVKKKHTELLRCHALFLKWIVVMRNISLKLGAEFKIAAVENCSLKIIIKGTLVIYMRTKDAWVYFNYGRAKIFECEPAQLFLTVQSKCKKVSIRLARQRSTARMHHRKQIRSLHLFSCSGYSWSLVPIIYLRLFFGQLDFLL